jgi:hypothetical protein
VFVIPSQVQIFFAIVVLAMTFWYQIALGMRPLLEMHEGVATKYRIHVPEMFERVSLKHLVGADMPTWMMIAAEQEYQQKILDATTKAHSVSEAQLKHIQDFGRVLDEYKKLIFDSADSANEKRHKPALPSRSFQQYLKDGPVNDLHLDHGNFSILTRLGGRITKQASEQNRKSKSKRLSFSGVQQQLASGFNQMKEMPGLLQNKINQMVLSSDNFGTHDAHLQATNPDANWYEVIKTVMHFIIHVFIGGFFDGINSMLQLWAVLVMLSAFLRQIQVLEVEEINTAIMSFASLAYFLSFMLFYRVNPKFGPFIVILKEMTVEDLSRWLVLVALFLIGTGQALFIILDEPMSFLKVFKWMLGDTEPDSQEAPFDDTKY